MTDSERPTSRDDFNVAIICALVLETDAVEASFDELWDDDDQSLGQAAGDTNAYITGRIGRHNVVLVPMPGTGKVSAATVASNLKMSFANIRLALVVGICGGTPTGENGKEIILGDVVISEGIVQYDFGRRFPDRFTRKTSVLDVPGRPTAEVRSAFAKLKRLTARQRLSKNTSTYYGEILKKLEGSASHPGAATDQLFESTYRHKHQDPLVCATCASCNNRTDEACQAAMDATCVELGCEKIVRRSRHACIVTGGEIAAAATIIPSPLVHFGLMASGDTVMRSGQDRDDLSRSDSIIALEMETVGVWDVLPCVGIKGVCDYSDSHKNKLWQGYAAANAAACTKAFLKEWPMHLLVPNQPTGPVPSLCHNGPAFAVPFERDVNFVGRVDVMDALDSDEPRTALQGIGGIGKSQIAVEYCYRYKTRHPDVPIFWVYASTMSRFQSDYMAIARLVNIGDATVRSLSVAQGVAEWLNDSTNGPWLMVLDNADDDKVLYGEPHHSNDRAKERSQHIMQFVPRQPHGRILLTTRNRVVGQRFSHGRLLEVPPFALKEALQLLRRRLAPGVVYSDDEACQLFQALDWLPLAITQAVCYINEKDVDLSHYLELLGDQQTARQLLSLDHYDPRRDDTSPNAVFVTWQVSLNEIIASNQRAINMLSLLSFVDRHSIPAGFIENAGESRVSFDIAVGVLKAFSLVTEEKQKGVFSIHRLIQACTRAWLESKGTSNHWQAQALLVVSKLCPVKVDFHQWPTWEVLGPHLDLVLAIEFCSSESQLRRNSTLSRLASYNRKRGKFLLASVQAEEAYKACEKLRGSQDHATLIAMYVWAQTLKDCDDIESAERLTRALVNIRTSLLGETHEDTLSAMILLTRLLSRLKKTDECAALSWRTFCCIEKQHGQMHPESLTAMNDLAVRLQRLNSPVKAETIFRKCINFKRIVHGPEHEETLRTMYSFGGLLLDQERYEEANKILKSCSDSCVKHLGEEHPVTLMVNQGLGEALCGTMNFTEAGFLLRTTLASRERLFGDGHPFTESNKRAVARLDRQVKQIAKDGSGNSAS